jgi:signal transduction histidine kinase
MLPEAKDSHLAAGATDLPQLPGTRSKLVFCAATAALVGLIGLLDYLTGYELAFLAFYLIPVTLAVWYVGAGWGIAISILSATVSVTTDYIAGAHYSSSLVPVWNALISSASYFAIVWTLSRLRALHQELEVRVHRRTVALTNEVRERTRLELELLTISEREQRRIGHDLHDSLGQHLTGAALAGQVLVEKLQARSLPEAAAADHLVDLVEQGIELTRKLARGLNPVEMEAEGCTQALADLAAGIQDSFKVSCTFECNRPVSIPAPAAVHLYRIAQESITNAIRHGKAAHIIVCLDSQDGSVTLTISDDGCGLPEHARNGHGMGLRIMAFRAGVVGAAFKVERRPEGGTRVTCSLPAGATSAREIDVEEKQNTSR